MYVLIIFCQSKSVCVTSEASINYWNCESHLRDGTLYHYQLSISHYVIGSTLQSASDPIHLSLSLYLRRSTIDIAVFT